MTLAEDRQFIELIRAANAATAFALARSNVTGCTELTAHPRPRKIRLATGKPFCIDAGSQLRREYAQLCCCNRLTTRRERAQRVHAKKILCVRYAEENERAQHRSGNEKEKNGEEKTLQKSGEAAEGGSELLLLAADAF